MAMVAVFDKNLSANEQKTFKFLDELNKLCFAYLRALDQYLITPVLKKQRHLLPNNGSIYLWYANNQFYLDEFNIDKIIIDEKIDTPTLQKISPFLPRNALLAYEKISEIRCILDNEKEPASERIKQFKTEFQKQTTQQILHAVPHPEVRPILKKIGYVLINIATIGLVHLIKCCAKSPVFTDKERKDAVRDITDFKSKVACLCEPINAMPGKRTP